MNDAPREELKQPRFEKNFTEFIGIRDDGHLGVEERDCVELAETFGTPLYVVSENQFRHNYRQFRDAFARHYPNVEVMYSNKAMNGPALRHVMNQEGAGGDCFGENELYIALLAGRTPGSMVLNGSNKTPHEIEVAVLNGVCINIDAMGELDLIDETARRLGRDADVGIRVKLELKPLGKRFATQMHGPGSLGDQARNHKWGMPLDQTLELVKRIEAAPHLRFQELNYHLSRMDNITDDFVVMAHEMVEWAAAVKRETGVAVPTLDLGGGWAQGRPERTGPHGEDDVDTPSFEEYAKTVCTAVKNACGTHGVDLPGLKFEVGRSLIGSAVVALGRVGATKEWPEYAKSWVNLDLSTNHLSPVAEGWHYHVVVANKANAHAAGPVDVVGPLCSPDNLAFDRPLPSMDAGDIVAFLDAGAYTESRAANFNAQLRPAAVLVSGDDADVITEREQLRDVMGRFRVPSRVLNLSFGRT